MKSVQIESHYGQSLTIDQCPKCNGIWFDASELFRAKAGTAKNIEPANTTTFSPAATHADATLYCPIDHAPLLAFSDINFPKDIKIESCRTCGGFWLNHGEFTQFQRFCEQNKQLLSNTFNEQIDRLLANHNTNSTYSTLGKLGTFLSTPIEPYTLKVLPKIGEPLEPPKTLDTASYAAQATMYIPLVIKLLQYLSKIK
jgi:Zn-finger nucleic acid-binding protein